MLFVCRSSDLVVETEAREVRFERAMEGDICCSRDRLAPAGGAFGSLVKSAKVIPDRWFAWFIIESSSRAEKSRAGIEREGACCTAAMMEFTSKRGDKAQRNAGMRK